MTRDEAIERIRQLAYELRPDFDVAHGVLLGLCGAMVMEGEFLLLGAMQPVILYLQGKAQAELNSRCGAN